MRSDLPRRFTAAYHNPDQIVLEGFHPTRHALRFGAHLESAVTYDPDKLFAIAARLTPATLEPIDAILEVVDRATFDRLSPRKLSSPLLAIAPRPPVDLSSLLVPNGRPVIYLERPRNPGNVGAVIRVAAAAKAAGVLVSGTLDPWSPVVVRSATGLQFALDVASGELPADIQRPLVALDADGESESLTGLSPDSVLAIGGERYGLSSQLRATAHRTIAVPMCDGVSSLNLATAVSAVLFAWRAVVIETAGSPPW